MFSRDLFASRLRSLRVDRGLSMREFGEVLGVSDEAVRLWEKGKRTPPLETLDIIHRYFDVPASFLLNDPPFGNWEDFMQPIPRDTLLEMTAESFSIPLDALQSAPLNLLIRLIDAAYSHIEYCPDEKEMVLHPRRIPDFMLRIPRADFYPPR